MATAREGQIREYEELVNSRTREEVLDIAWSKLAGMEFPGVATIPRVCGDEALFEVTPGIDVYDRAGIRIEKVICARRSLMYRGDMVRFKLNADQHAPVAEGRIIDRFRSETEYKEASKLQSGSFWMVAQKRCAENRFPPKALMRVFHLNYGPHTDVYGCRFELPCGDTRYWVRISEGNGEIQVKCCPVELRADFGSLEPIRQAKILFKQYQKAFPGALTIHRNQTNGGGIISSSESLKREDVYFGTEHPE